MPDDATSAPLYVPPPTPFPKYDPTTDYLPTWMDSFEDHIAALHVTGDAKKKQHCLLLLGNLAELVRLDVSELESWPEVRAQVLATLDGTTQPQAAHNQLC